MNRLFAVIRSHGAVWQAPRSMEDQEDWEAHASFMNALEKKGFILLGGPFEGTNEVLLLIRATSADEIVERLSADPSRDILRISRITPWTLRLGSLS
jgi:uncharacterized protein YciI